MSSNWLPDIQHGKGDDIKLNRGRLQKIQGHNTKRKYAKLFFQVCAFFSNNFALCFKNFGDKFDPSDFGSDNRVQLLLYTIQRAISVAKGAPQNYTQKQVKIVSS